MQLKSPMPRAWVRRAGIAAVATLALGTGFVVWSAQPDNVVVRTAATTVADADMLMDVRAKIDDGALSPSGLRPIRFGDRIEYTYRDAGKDVRLLATVTPAGQGRFDIQASLERDGKLVATPRLITKEGEPAMVRVGEEGAAGAFRGVEVTMYLTSDTAPPIPPAPPEPPPAPPVPPAPPPPPVPYVKHAGSGAIVPSPPHVPPVAAPSPPPVPRPAPVAVPAPPSRAAAPKPAARASAPAAAGRSEIDAQLAMARERITQRRADIRERAARAEQADAARAARPAADAAISAALAVAPDAAAEAAEAAASAPEAP